MKSNQEIFITEAVNGFKSKKGRGSIYCQKPIRYELLVHTIVNNFSRANNNAPVFIVVKDYPMRQLIDKELKKAKVNGFEGYDYKFLSEEFIQDKYKYNYTLTIAVGVNTNTKCLLKLATDAKFMLNIMTVYNSSVEYITEVRKVLPLIGVTVTAEDVANDSNYSPVEEHRIGVTLDDDTFVKYNKFKEFISTSVAIFGDFDNIDKCRNGVPHMNVSGATFRNQIAYDNGWNEQLDVNIDFHRGIDEVYNPNALLERADMFYDYVRKRRELISNYEGKVNHVIDICRENTGKKILIVSKTGELATAITKAVNEAARGFVCGEFHDDIAPTYAIDPYGAQILIKSGAQKGQPKMLKARSISSLHMQNFNNGDINILSVKNSSSNRLKIDVDVVIITSPYCDTIVNLKKRFSDVTFSKVPTSLYTLYCRDTQEATTIGADNNATRISNITEFDDDMVFADN